MYDGDFDHESMIKRYSKANYENSTFIRNKYLINRAGTRLTTILTQKGIGWEPLVKIKHYHVGADQILTNSHEGS